MLGKTSGGYMMNPGMPNDQFTWRLAMFPARLEREAAGDARNQTQSINRPGSSFRSHAGLFENRSPAIYFRFQVGTQ